MARRILSNEFLKQSRELLEKGCANGGRVSRESLAAGLVELGYSATPDVVGILVESGELNTATQAWGLFRGRYGGIRELDLEAMAAEAKAEAEREAKKAAKAAEREAKKAAKAAATAETKAA